MTKDQAQEICGSKRAYVSSMFGEFYRCEGTMRQDQYIRVLRDNMLPSAASLYGEGEAFLLQLLLVMKRTNASNQTITS